MGELTQAMDLLGGNLSVGIQKYPTGKYGLAGSVPYELTKERGGMFPGRKTKVWDTEQEVIDALLAIGVDRFQLADCSWYKA